MSKLLFDPVQHPDWIPPQMFWPKRIAEENCVAEMLKRCGESIFSAYHFERTTGSELLCLDDRQGKIAY